MSKNTPALLMDSLNLPRFESIEDLAILTGLSSRLLYCLSRETIRYYKFKKIPKRNGSKREISIPSYTLHIIQRWILTKILNKIMPSNRAMAFRQGNQYGHKQNAFYHSHTLYGLSIDIKDFFPSITANKVYTLFSNIGYNKIAATILTNLCTLNGKLPQGSACSPALSNIICKSLDKRFIGLCEKRGIRFTRYADDMYFSCDNKALLLKNFKIFKRIVTEEGFFLNDSKTHFHTPSNRKLVTGVVVATNCKDETTELKAPKALKRKVRAEIFKCIVTGNYSIKEHILGEISYIQYIEKENSNQYLTRLKTYISTVGRKMSYFDEIISAYNANIFFKDLEQLNPFDFNELDDENGYYELQDAFQERKKYLRKHKQKDICKYKNWPEDIIEQSKLA